MRSVASLALAPGLALAAGAAATLEPGLRALLAPSSSEIGAALLVGGVVVAGAFRRGRAVLALAMLGISGGVLARCVFAPTAQEALARYAGSAVAVLLPCGFAVLAGTRERGAFTAAGIVRLTLLGAVAFLAALPWLAYMPRALDWPTRPLVRVATPWTAIPQLGIAAAVVAAATLATRLVIRRDPIDAGLLGALVLSMVALQSQTADGTGMWLAAGAVSIVAAAVQAGVAMAFRDALTGLPGRRAFEETLAALREPFAVAMVDIDRFKGINDAHGHDVGDQVLRMVATRVAAVGGGGRAFRVGGEEFAVLFAGRSSREVAPYLEAVRQAVESAEFTLRAPERPAKRPPQRASRRPEKRAPRTASGATRTRRVPVTVSIGLTDAASCPEPRAAVDAADAALYRAKRAGRNRVVRSTVSSDTGRRPS
jgi:diguanylate cyclase (GGDEF)-like protein